MEKPRNKQYRKQMLDLRPSLSAITLNINVLNSSTKRQVLANECF